MAAADAPRPYRLVVLSDHGQSQGATFLQRYGVTLEELARSASEAPGRVHTETGREDGAAAYLGAGLTEMARDDTVTARAAGRAKRRLEEDEPAAEAATADALPGLSVMASGNLGLISFPREPGRVTMERIEELHPRLLSTLRDHPGIAFALVRSERNGAVALGPNGARYLDADRVEGDDPLAAFGPNAAHHLRRTDGFPHCPDVLVNGTYWEETGEVAAFEELVGSHGGMGGTQSHPFVLYPADLPWPDEPVVGAEAVHRVFRGWLAELGHEAYRTSASPGDSTRTSTSGASSAT
jgi:hypothetical protein